MRKFWKVLQPHSIVLQAAVNKYYRLAFAQLNIRKHSAVGRNSLKFMGRGCGVHNGPANNQDCEGSSREIGKGNVNFHVAPYALASCSMLHWCKAS
jgi:hypothetical protein